MIPFDRCHHSEADSRVPTRWLDNGISWAKSAGLFRRCDHTQTDAVFHAAAGVKGLQFGPHLCVPGRVWQLVQLHHWCGTNEFEQRMGDLARDWHNQLWVFHTGLTNKTLCYPSKQEK